MTYFQLVVDGLSIGSLYALIALAMVIIYKTSEVPNFAQGEMAMLSTFVAYHLMFFYGYSYLASFVGALCFAVLLAVIFEFAFLRRAKEPNILNFIIITLGFERSLYGLAGWKWGADQRYYPSNFDPLPISSSGIFSFGNIVLSHISLVIMIVTVVLISLLVIFFKYTKLGVAMKATQQNQMASKINGIRTNRIMSITWGISAIVGAIAGMLFVPGTATPLDGNIMLAPLIKGFAAAVLGGMTTMVGPIGGGFILGIIEKFFGFYVSSEFETVVSFTIIVLVLWFRPSGLFSKHYVRKV